VLPVAVLFLSAQRLPVTPMRVEHGSWVVELRADGKIVNGAGAELGRVEGDEIDIGDTAVARVFGENWARSFYFYGAKQFDDDDALVFSMDGENRLLVDDDGELVMVRPSGERLSAGMRVTGVTRSSRRTALLLAITVRGLEREGPPPQPPRLALTLDAFAAAGGYFELASEVRLDRHFSLAFHSGGGRRRPVQKNAPWTSGWELGVEPRWTPFRFPDLYLAWSTRYARTLAPIGFDTWQPPPGLSSGPVAGLKMVFTVLAFDSSFGVLFPLVTPPSEPTHPPAAVVLRFGLGVSF
jgi:hypothetical protein